MTRRTRAMAVLGAAALIPASAFAFKLSQVAGGKGVTIAWAKRDIPWTLHKKASGDLISPGTKFDAALSAIQRSFDTWSSVDCTDIAFTYQGPTDRMDVGFDRTNASNNVNLLVFRDAGLCSDPNVVPAKDACHETETCADKYNCWDHDANTYALTTTNFNVANGQLADVDIEFNATPHIHRFSATTGTPARCSSLTDPTQEGCVATDVQNTATHEIGHFVGIDHSALKSATMYFSADDAETSKRVLTTDDTDALCVTYPRWSVASKEGGCAAAPPSAFGALLALGLVLRRKKA